LYTLCAGIHPARTLPVLLDCSTDRRELLDEPLYLGWRHERIRGAEYDAFVDAFVRAVGKVFPGALLQWEDFGKDNAIRLLDRYRDGICSFNDDVQGTGSVTLAGLMAAMRAAGTDWGRQRIVMYGAGSAAIGIGRQIVASMVKAGIRDADARKAIWLVDSRGLVHSGRKDLEDQKREFAQDPARISAWDLGGRDAATLMDVVRNVRPTMLIGVSAQPEAFSEAVVKEMAAGVERPVIFPLSNPNSKCEARPADIMEWTGGRALVATGSPFPDVRVDGRTVRIGQCNNAFVFPGIGLGVVSCGARVIPDSVFVAAAEALAEMAPSNEDPAAPLYPPVDDVRAVSRRIAIAVVIELQRCGLVPPSPVEAVERAVDANIWEPKYARYIP
ncbi:MAG: oxaloacetate-decarboxylating malate dehydrogenase, partial [Planctomycetota bacterium]|nr:oxaloacetate-decarboxylating malate dehydrogenase [Planctomycetota bacterium]